MNQRQFGKKSESNLSAHDGQMTIFDFFNEAEYLISNDLKEPEITEVVVSSYRRSGKPKGKREADLEGLPARIIEHKLSDEELVRLFPEGYKELPEEIYKRHHIIPETFIVDEHHVHVHASKKNNGIVKKHPGRPICSGTALPHLHFLPPSSTPNIQTPSPWNASPKHLKPMVSTFPRILWRTG